MLVYRLQLATIGIWFHLSRLFSKLYAAFETLGGKAHYIRTVQYPAFVQAGGNTSIEIIWQNKLDSKNAGRTVATDYSLAVSGACYSRYRATNIV